MNKKLLAIILCLVMTASVFAGCSKSEPETGVNVITETVKPETTPGLDENTPKSEETSEAAEDTALEPTEAVTPEPTPETTPEPTEAVEEAKPFIDEEALKAALTETLDATVDMDQRRALTEMSSLYKLLGRVYVTDDAIWCGFSGTGIEFVYTGDRLDITILGDAGSVGAADSQARFAVYLNGERVMDEMVDSKEKTYTVYDAAAKDAPQAPVTVKVIKLSECAYSTFGIKNIELSEGETIVPTEAKAHKIEFVGDSITCGYGVDDEVKENHFSTTTEDVTKTYGYKAAELLDADCSMVSMSGWGIISGYTSDPAKKSASQLIPTIYEKVGYSYQAFASTIKPQNQYWDFSQSAPDVVVINLGTNDASYAKTDVEKRNEYRDAYIKFIGKVRAYNPEADIFCVLGIMGADLYTPMENAVMAYRAETGDTKVRAIKMNTQSGKYGYAADWHPTEGTHEEAADTIVEKINKYLGWQN